MSNRTSGQWGMSILDRKLDGEPCSDGAMIVTPPPAESRKRIKDMIAGKSKPFTCRRIARLEASHYTPHDVCVANAAFIVRAVNAHDDLLAACKNAMEVLEPFNAEGTWEEAIAPMRAAIAKAE